MRIVLLLIIVLMIGCGGGGGGGSSSSGGNSNSGDSSQFSAVINSINPVSRGSRTSIRVIHGGIDAAPVSVFLGPDLIQSARYSQRTGYESVPAGELLFTVTRANDQNAIVTNVPATIVNKGEYSLFLHGSVKRGDFTASLIEDVVLKSIPGRGNLQVLNALEGANGISVEEPGVLSTGLISRNKTSGYLETTSGAHGLTIRRDASGGTISNVTVSVPDGGDLTVLVTGSLGLGVVNVISFEDLD